MIWFTVVLLLTVLIKTCHASCRSAYRDFCLYYDDDGELVLLCLVLLVPKTFGILSCFAAMIWPIAALGGRTRECSDAPNNRGA